MKNKKRFFIICAILFCVGLAAALAGFMMGGIKGIDKYADDHDWIEGSPGKLQVDSFGSLDFDSIEVSGLVDVVIIGGPNGGAYDWDDLGSAAMEIRNSDPAEGSVFLCRGEKVEALKPVVEKGVLKINAGQDEGGKISLNFTSDDWVPTVVVFTGERMLDSINLSGSYTDVGIYGAAFGNAVIYNESGDIELEGVKSGGLKVVGKVTDVDISGEICGDTSIETDSADVDFRTVFNTTKYKIDIKATSGELEINDREIETLSVEYRSNGGPHSLTIRTNSGDIEANFGTLFD